jgi:hypothetical protein
MEELITDNSAPVETPAQEPVTTTQEQETSSDNSEPTEDNADTGAESDLEELDYNGNRYKVPKELAPLIAKADSMQADYTRKTQEAAEMRRAAEARFAEVQNEAEINHEMINEISQLNSVTSRLSQYQSVNWQQWQAQDPQAAQAGMAEMMQLQNAHNELRGNVDSRRAEIAANRERQSATVISQAIEALSKPDPDKGWSGKFDAATKDTLTKFGKDLGYTDEELAGTNHPLMIKTLNLARIGYESLKKQRGSIAPPKTVANPVPTLGASRSSPSVDPEKMTQAQYNKWRADKSSKRA